MNCTEHKQKFDLFCTHERELTEKLNKLKKDFPEPVTADEDELEAKLMNAELEDMVTGGNKAESIREANAKRIRDSDERVLKYHRAKQEMKHCERFLEILKAEKTKAFSALNDSIKAESSALIEQKLQQLKAKIIETGVLLNDMVSLESLSNGGAQYHRMLSSIIASLPMTLELERAALNSMLSDNPSNLVKIRDEITSKEAD